MKWDLKTFLNETINKELNEIARWKEQNYEKLHQFEVISKYVSVNEEEPQFYFHLSTLNKLGINPKSKWGTPFGIYAYPLIDKTFNQLVSNKLPFAKSRPYIHIFSVRNPNRLLKMNSYSAQDFEQDLLKLKQHFDKDWDDLVEVAKIDIHPIEWLWHLTMNLTGDDIVSHDNVKWSVIFRKILGYGGIYDNGAGLIHRNEPYQAVFFSTNEIEYKTLEYNPHAIK